MRGMRAFGPGQIFVDVNVPRHFDRVQRLQHPGALALDQQLAWERQRSSDVSPHPASME